MRSRVGRDLGRRNRRHPKGEFPRLIHDLLIKTCTFELEEGPEGRLSTIFYLWHVHCREDLEEALQAERDLVQALS